MRNLKRVPAVKQEIVDEARSVAQVTESIGLITGPSTRVTGALRLALAGILEAKLILDGLWASE